MFRKITLRLIAEAVLVIGMMLFFGWLSFYLQQDNGSVKRFTNKVVGKIIYIAKSPYSAYQEKMVRVQISRVMKKHGGKIKLAASRHGYNWREVLAFTVVETGNSDKKCPRSSSGALGPMQLKPGTAKEMGIKNPCHPYDNIWAGTKYLKKLRDHYGYRSLQERALGYHDGPTGAKVFMKTKSPSQHFYVKRVKNTLALVNAIY